MSDQFFVGWDLWQQLSFFLGCSIVVVIFAGILRLQYLTWKSKRVMIQDEEKKARLAEVRSTGLRVKKDNDIPFGLRAIQSGIEVDGIWISRPATPISPTEKRFASLTTLVTEDFQNKGKEVDNPDIVDTASPAASPRLSPRLSPNDYYRPKQPSQLRNVDENDSTMLRVHDRRSVEAYVPNNQRRPGPPSQRTSGSSENDQLPQHQQFQQSGFQPPQFARPARDYSPSVTSSRGNARTPDPFNNGSRTNSLSGYPTMEYTDVNGMSHPIRTFLPGQQTRRQ